MVLLQIINYIYSPWKNVKKNAVLFKLFSYKVFVHWRLKLLNFLMDSILISLLRLKKIYQVLHNRLLEKFWNQVTYHLNLWIVNFFRIPLFSPQTCVSIKFIVVYFQLIEQISTRGAYTHFPKLALTGSYISGN